MKKFLYSFITILFLVLLLIFPNQAVNGAKNGLLLWFNTIVPTLLPFMIVSNIIIKLNITYYITFFISPFLNKLFHISTYGAYAFLTGFVFGYPMGAKITADLRKDFLITHQEASYLLSFCNNVSPVFIINYIVLSALNEPSLIFATLGIIYGSSLICAVIFLPQFIHKNSVQASQTSQHHIYNNSSKNTSHAVSNIDFKIVDESIMNGFETITKLGGYIILFGILSSLITVLPLNNKIISIITAITEITNGISLVSSADYFSFELKYIIIVAAASFGGLSSIAQTAGMIKSSSLSVKSYIFSKIINTTISIIMTSLYLYM